MAAPLSTAAPIRLFLEEHEMTQQEFAAMTGVSQSAVSQWINGARGIDLRTAKQLEKRTRGKITVRALFPKLFAKAS